MDPASYRQHYESTAARIFERLRSGMDRGELRDDLDEAHAWAIMGMNVFLGLRFAIWAQEGDDLADIVGKARHLLADGLKRA